MSKKHGGRPRTSLPFGVLAINNELKQCVWRWYI